MIMCHTVTNNFVYRAIKYQLYQSCQGGGGGGGGEIYALLFKFSSKRKFF